MAGINVWESVWWLVLMCESLVAGINVWESDGWY